MCQDRGECDNNMVLGNSVDIDLNKICDSEIRADIVVNQINVKRIWGQIVNCEGKPMKNMLIKLIRVVCECGRTYYEGVAHTITNCEGFYQFDICADDKSCYKILAGRAEQGGETIIDTNGGNCDPCGYYDNCYPHNPPYDPCVPRCDHVVPHIQCDCIPPHDHRPCGRKPTCDCNKFKSDCRYYASPKPCYEEHSQNKKSHYTSYNRG